MEQNELERYALSFAQALRKPAMDNVVNDDLFVVFSQTVVPALIPDVVLGDMAPSIHGSNFCRGGALTTRRRSRDQ